MSDHVVDTVIERALQAVRRRDATSQREARLRELEAEIKRLVLAIAKWDDSDEMLSALKEQQTELRKLKAAKASGKELTEEGFRSTVQQARSDIAGLLKKAPEQAKAKLSEHLKEILMTPLANGSYLASGEWGAYSEYGGT